MSTISPSVLNALSNLVPPPDKINYICFVEWNYQTWYLALGREFFYFIKEDLSRYKEPPVPYRKIEACCLCSKRKTLMAIKLNLIDKDNKSALDYKNDNLLYKTYPGAELRIYSQDRKAALDSFICYWQIDHMIKAREFGLFPLVPDVVIAIDKQEELKKKELMEENNIQSLKTPFNLPGIFTRHEEKRQKSFDMKGYSFFISSAYERNKEKESECLPVENKKGSNDIDPGNKFTFQVKDPIPVDYLDKMSDNDRDLKLLGESIADDFLKNCEGADIG